MAHVVKDRVMETTASTGTGTITLGGAVAGYQSFSVIGNGNTTYYTIVGGTEWEVGIGTYTSSGTTLSRTTVLESSNGGSLVNFSAGTKNVFVTYPAEESVDQDTAMTLTNKTISADNNTLSGIAASSFVLSNASGNIDGAAAQKAIPSGVVVGTTDTQTLTNKTVNLASNTLTTTLAQLNTAISDADVPSTTGSGASGTWGISVTGNAATATTAAGSGFYTQATGSEGTIGARITGQSDVYLFNSPTAWGVYSAAGGTAFNYTRSSGLFNFNGNANTVTNGLYTNATQTNTANKSFQASNSAIANATGGLNTLEVIGTGGAAMMTFHRPGAYATYFGLDSDNQFKYGGWSAGAASYTFITSGNIRSQMPSGSVLQVLSTAKTDVFSVASSTFTDITGLSVSITPRSSSSKILIMVDAKIANSTADASMIKLVRGSTDIYIGDAASNRIRTSTSKSFVSNGIESCSIVFLDSPSTTSSTTYKIQLRVLTGTAFLNRSNNDTDNGAHPRTASSITVMEVQG